MHIVALIQGLTQPDNRQIYVLSEQRMQ